MKVQKVSKERARKLSMEILEKAERERNKFAEEELKMSDTTNHEAQIQSLLNQVVELQKKVWYLECLEACGVDNWEGCYDAMKMMRGDYPEYCDEEDDYIDLTIKDPEIHINVTEMNFTMLNEWRAVCKELYYKMTDLLMEDGIDPEAKFCMELKLGKQSSGTIYKLINLNNENTP